MYTTFLWECYNIFKEIKKNVQKKTKNFTAKYIVLRILFCQRYLNINMNDFLYLRSLKINKVRFFVRNRTVRQV